MKTMNRTLIAGLVATAVLAMTTVTNAQSPRSLFNQVVKSIQGPGQSFQAGQNGPNRKFQNSTPQFRGGAGKHFGGGHNPGNWGPQPGFGYPKPPCGNYCPPPPPPCFVYIVYYYDCHYGWKTYGTYHSSFAAQNAVSSLQHQGYRAYMQKVRR